jgi:peptidoglycan/xylan/chitin deacetylase (PgdA/CDA1 family)
MFTPVIMYHNLAMSDSEEGIHLNEFEKQIKFINKLGFKSVNLNELDKLESKNIIITFDDGYENVHKFALPILNKYKFKATSFIITNKIDHYNDWDNSKLKHSKTKHANKEQIAEWISNGFEIGSHTTEHQNLTMLDKENKKKAINDPIIFFKEEFNYDIKSFCYPYGAYDYDCLDIVKENYKYAVTTKRGRYNPKINNFQIPRVPINKNESKFKIFLKLLTFYEDIKYKPLKKVYGN